MTDSERELMDSILDSNEKLIRINEELINVNKGWQKLATEMLHMWAEERKERNDGSDKQTGGVGST